MAVLMVVRRRWLKKNKKNKKLVFLGNKTEFYQMLKVEDNTICLGYDFWAVRLCLTFGLGLAL